MRKNAPLSRPVSADKPTHAPTARKPLPAWAMGALLVCAALLIAAGAVNGGLRDVLYKAIRICTECIGLS